MKLANEMLVHICPDYAIGAYEQEGRTFIASQLLYPNGDCICAYIEEGKKGQLLTDMGTTLRQLSKAGIEMTEKRIGVLNYLANSTGAELDAKSRSVIMHVESPEKIGPAFRSFCDAVARMSVLEYGHDAIARNMYDERVDRFLRLQLTPRHFTICRRYFDPDIDPDKLYPIDWALFRANIRRHIFVVGSRESSILVPATVHYYANRGVHVPSLALISPGVRIGKRHTSRLQHAVSEILFQDVHENEDRIMRWAEAA